MASCYCFRFIVFFPYMCLVLFPILSSSSSHIYSTILIWAWLDVQEDGGPDEGGLQAAVQLPGEAKRVGVLRPAESAPLHLVLHHGHQSGRCARPPVNPRDLLLNCTRTCYSIEGELA